jgi:hypothetical protein
MLFHVGNALPSLTHDFRIQVCGSSSQDEGH